MEEKRLPKTTSLRKRQFPLSHYFLISKVSKEGKKVPEDEKSSETTISPLIISRFQMSQTEEKGSRRRKVFGNDNLPLSLFLDFKCLELRKKAEGVAAWKPRQSKNHGHGILQVAFHSFDHSNT